MAADGLAVSGFLKAGCQCWAAMTGHAPSLLETAAGRLRESGVSPLAALLVAGAMAANILWLAATSLTANVEDFQFVAIVYGPLVALVGIAALRWRATRLAGALASVLFMMLTTHAIGLLAMLGLTAGMPLIDAQLAAADLRLGVDHHAIAALAAEHRAAAGLLGHVYNASGPLVVLTGVALALTGQGAHLARYWLIFVATGVITCALSIVLPAVGTYAHLGLPALTGPDMPQGAAGSFHMAEFERLRGAADATLGPFDIQGVVTFPSFHTAMALVIAYGAWRLPFMRWPGVIIAALTIIATVPIGGHYVVDVIAACLLFALVARAVSPARRAVSPAPALQPAE